MYADDSAHIETDVLNNCYRMDKETLGLAGEEGGHEIARRIMYKRRELHNAMAMKMLTVVL